MSKHKYFIISFFTLVTLFASIYVHQKSHSVITESFQQFTDQFFSQEVTSSTLTLHYTLEHPEAFGITAYPITYDQIDPDDSFSAQSNIKKQLDVLHSFSYQDLAAKDQLSYDILQLYLENALEGYHYPYYDEPLGSTTGIQAQLPVLLAEYHFSSAKDVETYLQLLSTTDQYFSALLEYEQEKSHRGLFMPEKKALDIIHQCQSFIASPANENLLVTVFNQKTDHLSALSAEEKKDFQLQNLHIISTHVIPAYQNLADGLEELLGTSTNENGLFYLPCGKSYYEYLIRSKVGSYLPVSAIENRIRTQIQNDLQKCHNLVKNNLSPSHPLEDFFDSPEEMLEDLQKQILDDFPAPPAVKYEVNYVPASLSKYLSPAFYLTPPIDAIEENVIYLNTAANYNQLELYTTLAHEGYPGHLYQNVYCSQHIPPFQTLLSPTGFAEGWATYVEMESYRYACSHLTKSEQQAASFLRLNRSIMLGISSLVDIYVHERGFTREEVRKFLMNLGFVNPDSADTLFDAVLESPANYLNYYLGYLSFLDLRSYIQKHCQTLFSLKEFHAKILEIGPCPFPVLEKYLRASFF